MLTNDDGYLAPGLAAVRAALTAAGHHVITVAPAANQSGSGARLNFSAPLVVSHPAKDIFAVEGSPADSAEFGLSTVFAGSPPDVVISGTNTGQNITSISVSSGTVGAAVTALNEGVPAIAVSTEIDLADSSVAPPYDDTADFVVDLVSELQDQQRRGQLLPAGVGLNVNYPIVESGGRAKGVELTRSGSEFIDLDYDHVVPAVGESRSYDPRTLNRKEKFKGADSTALKQNEVAVTAINGNYDAVQAPNASSDIKRIGWVVRALDRQSADRN